MPCLAPMKGRKNQPIEDGVGAARSPVTPHGRHYTHRGQAVYGERKSVTVKFILFVGDVHRASRGRFR